MPSSTSRSRFAWLIYQKLIADYLKPPKELRPQRRRSGAERYRLPKRAASLEQNCRCRDREERDAPANEYSGLAVNYSVLPITLCLTFIHA